MKVTSFIPQTNFNASNRKEKLFYESYEIVTYNGKEFHNPISLRLYGSNAKNYACIWINAGKTAKRDSVHVSGTGNAGGYGYHRASAAVAEALQSAGFKFDSEISGVGESAINDALKAIAKHLGFKKFTIVNAHA